MAGASHGRFGIGRDPVVGRLGRRGCAERLWLHVAAARAERHPADALEVHRRQLDRALQPADKRAYREVVALLTTMRPLYAALRRTDHFDQLVGSIRETTSGAVPCCDVSTRRSSDTPGTDHAWHRRGSHVLPATCATLTGPWACGPSNGSLVSARGVRWRDAGGRVLVAQRVRARHVRRRQPERAVQRRRPHARAGAAAGRLTGHHHRAPPPGRRRHWLPAPAGPCVLALRAYEGRPEVVDATWFPPDLAPAEGR